MSKQDITPDDSIVPIYRIELSAEEIAERLTPNAKEIEAKEARQTKLNSAITKLKALGLTESEANVIIGLE